MSGATTAAYVIGGAMLASTAYSAYAGNKTDQNQRSAQRARPGRRIGQSGRQGYQQRPIRSARTLPARFLPRCSQGKAGASGTMLTGPSGIDQDALSLGKNTLLGG